MTNNDTARRAGKARRDRRNNYDAPPTPAIRAALDLTEVDLDLLLDALLAFERATSEEGRLVAVDEDHVDYGDPATLDRLAARADHATALARRVGHTLDALRA